MKELFSIFKRFIPPYKLKLIKSVLFNLLHALFGVFAVTMLIPIMEILFTPENIDQQIVNGEQAVVVASEVLEEDGAVILTNDNHKSGTTANSEDIDSNDIIKKAKAEFYTFIINFSSKHGIGMALLIIGLFAIVATALKTGFAYLAAYELVYIRNGVVRDIRKQIYIKILSLPLPFFSEEKKGDIIARMTGDVQEVEASVMSSLDMLFQNPILIIVYLIGMLITSWELTIFVFILLPIMGFVIGRVGKNLKKQSRQGQNKIGEILSLIEETLSGLRIVKAFNAENKMEERFSNENEGYRKIQNRMMRRRALAHPMSEFLGTIVVVIILWYGGNLIISGTGTLTGPVFIAYIGLFYMIINPAKNLSNAYYNVRKGLAAMERIDEILYAESSIKEPIHPVKLTTFNNKIEYKDVSFSYTGNIEVLKDINITINKGETIALVGQSGSGKSTFVDLLPRFYDIEQGEITIDGVNIKDFMFYDLHELMGNVNQDPILFNDTIYNNIAFGVDSTTSEEVEHAARIANAHEFIMQTENGYQTNIGDRGGKLSGGQRQRLSIARAVLKNPPIMILDEATSALDTESEKLVQEALDNLMKNRTSIVIAHRLSTIRDADLICVFHEGKIVERGRHEDLLALNGHYTRLYNIQNF